ncbi:MAG: sulfate reduction electron transfer complex DsrMKJOP subunit DsrP [Candidatus Methylomirabilia bacterium]
MLEKALSGSKGYWRWVTLLLALIGIGVGFYAKQFSQGLGITGMSRDVSWGFYIAQLTFFVGVAASAVMLVIPYYLHNYKKFGKITILGEFVAIGAVTMCLLFVIVDLGQPMRLMNVILHPTPNSVLFWDMIVLNVYLFLNLLIGWTCLTAEKKGVPHPKWIKPFIYLSVPWAVSIHTVTAFLYAGLPGRGFWLSAVMAPRFLTSAFAAGPALLILLALLVRKVSKFDPGTEQIQTLAKIVAYALPLNLFLLGCEIFTVFYSGIPDHMLHFQYLYFGLHGFNGLVPWMWASVIMAVTAIVLLVNPGTRRNETVLAWACVMTFLATWIDKGMGMISGGFVPNPLEEITEYMPTFPEVMITVGIWAIGALIITVLYKIAIAVREQEAA